MEILISLVRNDVLFTENPRMFLHHRMNEQHNSHINFARRALYYRKRNENMSINWVNRATD